MGDIVPFREKIDTLDRELSALPQVQLALRHIMADGLAARVCHIPAGVCVVGAEHRKGHINILLQGSIGVATEDGCMVLNAPMIFAAPAGTKRAGVAITDVIWANVHATSASTPDEADADAFVEFDRLQKEVW
jgi:hypothetical protein